MNQQQNNNNNPNNRNNPNARNKRDFRRDGRPGFNRSERADDYKEKVISINRVTKVVKGGKNMSFRALVVVGDGKGSIGMGTGKASEVVDAVRKGIDSAKKNLLRLSFDQGSIPHNVQGRHNSSTVQLFRARKGTGLIAATVAKSLFELGGLHNIVCKIHGSTNPANVLLAIYDALKKIKTRGQIRLIRKSSKAYAAAVTSEKSENSESTTKDTQEKKD